MFDTGQKRNARRIEPFCYGVMTERCDIFAPLLALVLSCEGLDIATDT